VWDLGSSSFQLLACKLGPSQTLVPVLKRRSLLNLGLEVGVKGMISPERVTVSLAAAKRLRRALDSVETDVVVAFATAALRDATNGGEVVGRLEKVIGTPITVLDGKQEARLCFLGQRAGTYVGDEPVLGIDLGGGSFELVVGDRFDIYLAASAPLGPARLRGELRTGQRLDREDRKELRERVREALEPLSADLSIYPKAAVRTVLSGGTARALARLAIAKTCGHIRPSEWVVNQVDLPVAQVAELADMLARLDLDERKALPGMPARRAASLPIGACVLQAIADELGISHYVVSEWGLREGALLDALVPPGHAA
jgi:exopolyphosphatase / guanosine-5'-triphosphate,3'-diphosphate pyrophosphatase